MRSSILKNINKIMLCTSSKYLDECIEAKNNILDITDELESKMRIKDEEIKDLKTKIPKELPYEEKLQLVPLYGNVILED